MVFASSGRTYPVNWRSVRKQLDHATQILNGCGEREFVSGATTKRSALAKPAMPILGEGRMIRHSILQTKPTEPAIGQIQMHFFAQPLLFRPNERFVSAK